MLSAGSFNANLSATYVNLAAALEWTNFNFLSSDSEAATAVYATNLDAATSSRRLQQSVVGYVQSAQQVHLHLAAP